MITTTDATHPNAHYYRIALDSPLPRYYQIEQSIKELIAQGLLRVGDALPAERELGVLYGVNRMTVRQAVTELCSAGVLRRVHGVGTFVTEPQPLTPLVPAAIGFSERMRSAGLQPTSRVLAKERVLARSILPDGLDVPPDAALFCLKRLRLGSGEPLLLETSYLPEKSFAGLFDHDLETQSLYDVLAVRYQTRIYEVEQTLEPTLLRPDEAECFGLKSGQPAMLVSVIARDEAHTFIEFSKAVVRGDRCRYYFKIEGYSAPHK